MNDEPDSTARAADGAHLLALPFVASQHAEAWWDRDPEPERRRWRLGSAEDLWRQVLAWRCERWAATLNCDEVAVVEQTNGAEPA